MAWGACEDPPELDTLLDLKAEGPEAIEGHRFERQPTGTRGRHRFIRQARPGGWRDNLSPAERWAMYEAMGDALVEFAYEADESLAQPVKASSAQLSTA